MTTFLAWVGGTVGMLVLAGAAVFGALWLLASAMKD